MRETVPSSVLATQTEPCPIARATGLRPTSTWPTTRERCGSITATESGGTAGWVRDDARRRRATEGRLTPPTSGESSEGSWLRMALESPQVLSRLEPELLLEQPPTLAVHRERIRLTATAVEGEHQLAADALA